MPGVPNQETAHEALVRVCNEIDQSGTGGNVDDYAFIRAILQDVVVDAMFQTHDKSGEPMALADHNSSVTVNRLLDQIDQDPTMNEPETRELFDLLADKDMQAVLMAHDDIARKSFEPVRYPAEPKAYKPAAPQPAVQPAYGNSHPPPAVEHEDLGPMKMVSVRRTPGEPLGITVGNPEDGDADQLVVLRIAQGSTTDKQGLIHVGDVIVEVNGTPVSTSEELGSVIQRSGPEIRFLVLPENARNGPGVDNRRYLKAHFSHNPNSDSQALPFEQDDILAILKDNDKNWWECRNLRTDRSGKIPSPSFEERRRQMTQMPPEKTKSSLLCGLGKSKKKKPVNNMSNKQDQGPLVLYEEVIHVRPFRHRCLVLVGAQGIGRRSIKNRLIQMKPKEFGAPTPNTSRAMREGEVPGRNYHFLSRDEMDRDIKSGKYLEYGELNNNYYGTSFAALKLVIDSGKTCIVDPKSAALSKLRTVDWMPFVVFVKPTDVDALRRMNQQAINDGVDTQRKTDDDLKRILDETQRIQRQFIHFCDTSIPYDNFDNACKVILQLLETADSTPQFVPSAWDSATERVSVAA